MDDVEAVYVRQAEIDDHDVGLSGADFHQAIGPGRRLEESVSLTRQRRPQKAPDLRLVLDEDDAGVRHRRGPPPGARRPPAPGRRAAPPPRRGGAPPPCPPPPPPTPARPPT